MTWRKYVGYPCQICQHTNLDHSMYDPQRCLVWECECIGLKLDPELAAKLKKQYHGPTDEPVNNT